MTAANVTPLSPIALPYTYTANYGTAYQFASVSLQGCVDTVYPLTANAGGVFNVKGVPLPAASALSIIQQANNQFGPIFIACQSLLNQLPSTVGTASGISTSRLDLLPGLGFGWIIDDIALGVIVVILLGVGINVWHRLVHKR